MLVGMLPWMAPEIIAHDDPSTGIPYHKATDIYTLVIALWKIVTCKTPICCTWQKCWNDCCMEDAKQARCNPIKCLGSLPNQSNNIAASLQINLQQYKHFKTWNEKKKRLIVLVLVEIVFTVRKVGFKFLESLQHCAIYAVDLINAHLMLP